MKLKLLAALLASSLWCIPAFSQSTTVSGQVTDAGAQAWNNGSFTAQFVPNPQFPTISSYTWTGGTLNQTISGTLNATGGYTGLSIPSNSAISPQGSHWQFSFCPQASSPCFSTAVITITGGTQTVNATPPAIAIQLSNPPGPFTQAYTDAEIISTPLGGQYYNTTSSQLRVCTAISGNSCSTWGGSSSSASSAAQAWYLSRSCGTATNCTTVKSDGHYVTDATSNSTTTITCPNNDCNFTGTDFFGNPVMKVGQKIWATTQGTGAGVGFLIYTTSVCPVTTVASFTAQSVTVNLACTANGTANVALYWGDDDGAALHGLDAAVGCASVYVPDPGPNGLFMLDSRGFFTTAPLSSMCNQQITTSVGAIAPALIGTGWNGSQSTIMISPDATWADAKACTGASKIVFIGCTLRAAANIQILGSGLTSASNANCPTNLIVFSTSPASSTMDGVDMAGVCPGATGVIGIELNSLEQHWREGGVQSSGTIAANVHSIDVLLIQDDLRNDNVSGGIGLNVENLMQAVGIANYPIVAANIAGNYTGRGDRFSCGNGGSPAVNVTATGNITHFGDFVGVDGACNGVETIAAGGLSNTMGTQFKGSTTSIVTSGTITAIGGGNKITTGLPVSNSAGGFWQGTGVLYGTCRGTATSSATLGLYLFGQNSTANCTSTTVNLGLAVPQVPLSGSVFSLVVYAGTGCKSGNTCVFTVLKNGSATAITCSMVGPAAFCADNTHTDIPVFGDMYSVQFTTGATETLANVEATLLAW